MTKPGYRYVGVLIFSFSIFSYDEIFLNIKMHIIKLVLESDMCFSNFNVKVLLKF